MEAILMMRPLPCPSITLTAARQQRKTLVRSTSITRRQSSSDSSQIGNERPVIPALLTRMSSRPHVWTMRLTAVEVEHGHPRAAGGQAGSDGQPDAAGGAGDQRGLLVERHGGLHARQ